MNTSRHTLSLYHPNARGTGAAIKFALHPANDETDGYIMMLVTPQASIGDRTVDPSKLPMFDWDNSITAKLDFNDLCLILQVLRGETESISDGKGLYHQNCEQAINIRLNHVFEPCLSYQLDVYCRDRATGEERRSFMLFSPAEALGLSEAISGSMSRIAFGD